MIIYYVLCVYIHIKKLGERIYDYYCENISNMFYSISFWIWYISSFSRFTALRVFFSTIVSVNGFKTSAVIFTQTLCFFRKTEKKESFVIFYCIVKKPVNFLFLRIKMTSNMFWKLWVWAWELRIVFKNWKPNIAI